MNVSYLTACNVLNAALQDQKMFYLTSKTLISMTSEVQKVKKNTAIQVRSRKKCHIIAAHYRDAWRGKYLVFTPATKSHTTGSRNVATFLSLSSLLLRPRLPPHHLPRPPPSTPAPLALTFSIIIFCRHWWEGYLFRFWHCCSGSQNQWLFNLWLGTK